MSVAVQINSVSKRFAALTALDSVNFSVPEGSFFGLLGPNGAGKSTLINSIAGLVRPDKGSISVMGHDVYSDYRLARAALGIVPQELVYDPFFTVIEMLRLQAGYFGCSKNSEDWIEELLDVLDLTAKVDTNLQALSGGMKRRMLVAIALVHKPEVVVLDEPTAGVDVELRRALWKFIGRLHAQGRTIILTTHYLEEAEALCDQIAILDKGRLKALDSKQALLKRHPERFLCLKVADATQPLPAPFEAMVIKRTDTDLQLRLLTENHSVGDVLQALSENGIQVLDVHTREPGLEEVFLDLVSGNGDKHEF